MEILEGEEQIESNDRERRRGRRKGRREERRK